MLAINSIVNEITELYNDEVSSLAIDLRNELEMETPVDTTHASINWLIRQSPRRKEYGQRPELGGDRPPQPTLNEAQTGEAIAKKYDIRKNRYGLSVVNYVPYLEEINEGTHPAQQDTWEGKNPNPLRHKIGFVEKAIEKVKRKHGIS